MRERPLPEALATSLVEPKAVIEGRFEALKTLRGRYRTGFTPQGVTQGDRLLKAAIGRGLTAKWKEIDKYGPYGGADLYLSDKDGLYPMPDSLHRLLEGDDVPIEQILADNKVPGSYWIEPETLGTKFDECNWY